jgi:lipopolysaccharide transport system permease protein
MATETTTIRPARTQGALQRSRVRHSGRFLLSHGALLARVTRNDLAARYVGSLLGIGWTVVTPALFLGVYSSLYLFVYKAPVAGLTRGQFVVYLTSGIVPYLMTAEAIGSGVSAVVANRSILTNVVFPIDLLPPKAVLMAQPTMAVGMAMVLVGALATGLASWYLLLIPVIWFFQVLALLGVTWILSLINIVLRDLTQLIGIVLILLLIASPIAYTTDKVPASLKWIILINPLAYYILGYHAVINGQIPSALTCFGIVGFSVGIFGLGGWFFARMKAALVDYV